MELDGKVAVVTGGCSGIGLATAHLLGLYGAEVYVGDISPADESLTRYSIQYRECDVRDERDVSGLINMAITPSGRLDILVNNAGVPMPKPITDVTVDDWDFCFDTNVKGAFLACKHGIPYMRPGGGCIVNVASNAGLMPRWHDPVYSVSKSALVALTKSLALTYGEELIRVNAVCPGPVGQTRIMENEIEGSDDPHLARQQSINASPVARGLGRMIEPSEVADAILYLCNPQAPFVTGTCIAIDGAKSLGVPSYTQFSD